MKRLERWRTGRFGATESTIYLNPIKPNFASQLDFCFTCNQVVVAEAGHLLNVDVGVFRRAQIEQDPQCQMEKRLFKCLY